MAGTTGGNVIILSTKDLAKQGQLKDEQVNIPSCCYTKTLNTLSILKVCSISCGNFH